MKLPAAGLGVFNSSSASRASAPLAIGKRDGPVTCNPLLMLQMSDPEPPKLNKHGQEIWFKEAEGESGYAPVHRKGWITFILALVWICFSAGVSVLMVLLWAFSDLSVLVAFITPFIVAAAGLLLVAITVRRHS